MEIPRAWRELGRVGHDPVAPIAFGAVQRLVGPLQDELGRIVGKFQRGDADARRHFERADPLTRVEWRRGDALTQPLAD